MKRIIQYLWSYIRLRPWIFAGLTMSMFLAFVPVPFEAMVLKGLIDGMVSSAEGLENQVWLMVWVFIGVVLIRHIGWKILEQFIVPFETSVMAKVHQDCFSYILRQGHNFMVNSHVGGLIAKAGRMARSVENLLDAWVFTIFGFIIQTLIMLVILWVENIWLFIGGFVWMVFMIVCKIFLWKWVSKYREAAAQSESHVSAHLSDAFSNHQNVLGFGGFTNEFNSFIETIRSWRKSTSKSWYMQNWVYLFSSLFIFFVEFGSVVGGVYLWSTGVISVGTFVLLTTYMGIFINRIYSINQIMRSSVNSGVDMLEMFEILDTPHDIIDVEGAKDLQVTKGYIALNDITFSYTEEGSLFEGFNLEIKPGERVGLVGVSGSGKSTIVKLVQRFYDVQSGSITIDNQNIADVTQESLHKQVGLVPQDPILFHRSLRENIAYGRPDATIEEVIEASKVARAHDFISQLENGYDTLVGERGVKLSGGERQRVAIARAILAQTPILIFDEATSALDSRSEKLIQDSLEEIFSGKTALVIAHRLSTIMKMDRIVVMSEGNIIEQGTHDELLTLEGHYASLWNIQSGEFIDDVSE